MMKKINRDKIKIKNLLGIVDNPNYEDLLFEIVSFLQKEGRLEDEFIKQEVSLKTRCRIEENLDLDLKKLQEIGYLEHLGWTKYRVKKHPWQ